MLPQWLKEDWKEALLLALVAAIVIELGINVFSNKTVWQRLTVLEHSVQDLQHERELEEQRTRLELDQLRQKSQQNSDEVKEVEQKVEHRKK